MVRGKTQMKRIENATSRQVTFSKRRNGLLKKAYELSVLCDAEVGLMIFSPRGNLHEFANPSMEKMLEMYQKCSEENSTNHTIKQKDNECLRQEIANMKDKISILESTQRKMLGEDLETCSMEELNQLEVQIEKGLSHIRAEKIEMLTAEIEQLKIKVFTMDATGFKSVQHIEVETQLGIRPPNCINHLS